jgi:hypothetical protein
MTTSNAVTVFTEFYHKIETEEIVKTYDSNMFYILLHQKEPKGAKVVTAVTRDGVRFIQLYTKIGNLVFYVQESRDEAPQVHVEVADAWRGIITPHLPVTGEQLTQYLEDSFNDVETNYFRETLRTILGAAVPELEKAEYENSIGMMEYPADKPPQVYTYTLDTDKVLVQIKNAYE